MTLNTRLIYYLVKDLDTYREENRILKGKQIKESYPIEKVEDWTRNYKILFVDKVIVVPHHTKIYSEREGL